VGTKETKKKDIKLTELSSSSLETMSTKVMTCVGVARDDEHVAHRTCHMCHVVCIYRPNGTLRCSWQSPLVILGLPLVYGYNTLKPY
jgi:hypothetical protein